uniref:Putative RNA-directed DNA polymerase from transposon BS n=1 Tax=Anoplophora glabripennis TaxID=217634 RepID=V5GR23_ANOGL
MLFLFQKNTPRELKDLRPISILPALSKILEYIVKDQIMNHLTINNILPVEQSGFREGHSCSTALLNVTDHIFRATDSGLCSILVLLDYSKAFDTISHDILENILMFAGFDISAVQFISNYLVGGQQRVVLKNDISNYINTNCGVPQGSVLGSTLFSLYTSSFPNFLKHCKIQMYADDTQLFYSFHPNDIQNSCIIINSELETLRRISLEHSLRLNPTKCVTMLFASRVKYAQLLPEVNITVDNVQLEVKNEVKVLGLTIDSDLRFNKHISNCVKKSIINLKILYKSRHILSEKLKILLCQSLVLSVFNYGDTVYGPCLAQAISQRIQKIQNYCLRFIYGIRKRNRVRHKLMNTKWLDMKNIRLHHSATLFKTIILNKSPQYLYNKIRFRTDHNLNTRFKGNLTPPSHKTATFERWFSYNMPTIYNALPLPQIAVCQLFQKNI